jgi:hypothetical protein
MADCSFKNDFFKSTADARNKNERRLSDDVRGVPIDIQEKHAIPMTYEW